MNGIEWPHRGMFDILMQYSDLVEPVSIDEGYIDITESFELGTPLEIADQIQKQVLNELDLPCSIGVAPNRFLSQNGIRYEKTTRNYRFTKT